MRIDNIRSLVNFLDTSINITIIEAPSQSPWLFDRQATSLCLYIFILDPKSSRLVTASGSLSAEARAFSFFFCVSFRLQGLHQGGWLGDIILAFGLFAWILWCVFPYSLFLFQYGRALPGLTSNLHWEPVCSKMRCELIFKVKCWSCCIRKKVDRHGYACKPPSQSYPFSVLRNNKRINIHCRAERMPELSMVDNILLISPTAPRRPLSQQPDTIDPIST